MNIKTESKITIEFEGYVVDGKLLTHDCPVGKYWGNETSEPIEIDRKLEEVGLMKGGYKITITIEKIE